MQLVRKSSLEANRMYRFEKYVLLDIMLTHENKHRKAILGKIISFKDILLVMFPANISDFFTENLIKIHSRQQPNKARPPSYEPLCIAVRYVQRLILLFVYTCKYKVGLPNHSNRVVSNSDTALQLQFISPVLYVSHSVLFVLGSFNTQL